MRTHNQLFIYFICLVSAMGGLLFGYDWVVIGGAKPFYEIYFDIAGNAGMQALTMSIALLGCLLGAMTAGALADRYGRKRLLIVSALVFFFSSWATGAASSMLVFIPARLVGYWIGGRLVTDVYCGSCSDKNSWKACDTESVDNRVRHSWGTDCKYAFSRPCTGECHCR